MSGTNNTIILSSYTDHPFKEGLKRVIEKHLAPGIAKNFRFYLEAELYNKKDKGVLKQIKDNNFICEVHYQHPITGLIQYVCDACSWWDEKMCEYRLLQMITDKVKNGELGQDWTDTDIRVSKDIRSGKFATKGGI